MSIPTLIIFLTHIIFLLTIGLCFCRRSTTIEDYLLGGSGGPWSYDDFLEAIRDPDYDEHEEMLEWVGSNFDPESFDVQEVNRLLK